MSSVGGTPSTRVPAFWNGDVAWATPTDITALRTKFISRTAAHISEAGLKESRLTLLPAGTVLVTSRATIGARAIATCPMATNQGFASLVPKDSVTSEFLYYALGPLEEHLRRLSSGSTFLELSKHTFKKVQILVPPPAERLKIAEILSSVDAAIERTEAVIERVREVKRALAQELLTRGMPSRHTRFKQTEVGEIPEDWEVVRLGDVADVQTGPFGAQLQGTDFVREGVPVLNIGNVRLGWLDLSQLAFVSNEKATELARYRLLAGDLLFSRMATVGRSCVVPSNGEGWLISYHLMRLRLDTGRVLPELLMEAILNLVSIRRQLTVESAGATREGVNSALLRNLRISLPSQTEQAEMVGALREIDARAEQEQVRIAELRRAKDALAMALLSGQIRVATVR